MLNTILTERLLELYDPVDALGMPDNFKWVDRVKPQPKYCDGEVRSLSYHKRRIQFFLDELRAGRKIDPIEIDNYCDDRHVYATPLITDGHHRLIAHIIFGAKKLRVIYGGRVDLLRYLAGKRKTAPED